MSAATLDIDRSLKARSTSQDPIIAAATADVPNARVTTLPPAGKTPAQKAKSAGRAKAAAREVAAQRASTQKKIDRMAAKMTGSKPRGTGNGSGPTKRITDSWKGKGGKEVEVGSMVKAPGIPSLKIVGRWSKRRKDSIIPFVTGITPDKTRKNVAAADCTVVKAPAK